MLEWWSYRPRDFLLFSERTYWRLFELENREVWPLQIVALLAGLAVLVAVLQPRRWSTPAAWGVLAVAWAAVALGFLQRYAEINWAASYAVPAFLLQALLLGWLGALRARLPLVAGPVPRAAGLGLTFYAVALHPLVAPIAGRPLAASEVVSIAPDPTAIATLGLLTLARRGAACTLLLAVPATWCLASALTLSTMGAWESWIPLAAVLLATAARLWPLPASAARPRP